MNNQERMAKAKRDSMTQWERHWQKSINWKDHIAELNAVYHSERPFYAMRRSALPAFTFPLPDIDVKQLRREAQAIIDNPQSRKVDSVPQAGYPEQFGLWKRYPIFVPKGYAGDLNANNFNADNYEYETNFDASLTELTKLIRMYGNKKRPIQIETLAPLGHIGLQTGDWDTNWTLDLIKLPLNWDSEVNLCSDGIGQIPMQLRELSFWNMRKPYVTHNSGKETAISINFPIKVTNKQTKDKLDAAVREKISSLLS
jgi:hypothetical protein